MDTGPGTNSCDKWCRGQRAMSLLVQEYNSSRDQLLRFRLGLCHSRPDDGGSLSRRRRAFMVRGELFCPLRSPGPHRLNGNALIVPKPRPVEWDHIDSQAAHTS